MFILESNFQIKANGKRLCEGAEIEAQKFSLALP